MEKISTKSYFKIHLLKKTRFTNTQFFWFTRVIPRYGNGTGTYRTVPTVHVSVPQSVQ